MIEKSYVHRAEKKEWNFTKKIQTSTLDPTPQSPNSTKLYKTMLKLQPHLSRIDLNVFGWYFGE